MNKKSVINLARLKRLMEARNWGDRELAEHAGLKLDTVYSVRVGRRKNTSSQTLMRIADALDTSADYLLGETEEEKPPLQKLPHQVRQLAEVARKLSEPRQEELLRIAALIDELDRQRQAESEADEMAMLLASIQRTTNLQMRKKFEELIFSEGFAVDSAS